LIYRHIGTSRHEVELAVFAWVEGWYNPDRIMAALDMRSPDEYEAAFYAATHHPATPHRRWCPPIRPPGNRGSSPRLRQLVGCPLTLAAAEAGRWW